MAKAAQAQTQIQASSTHLKQKVFTAHDVQLDGAALAVVLGVEVHHTVNAVTRRIRVIHIVRQDNI